MMRRIILMIAGLVLLVGCGSTVNAASGPAAPATATVGQQATPPLQAATETATVGQHTPPTATPTGIMAQGTNYACFTGIVGAPAIPPQHGGVPSYGEAEIRAYVAGLHVIGKTTVVRQATVNTIMLLSAQAVCSQLHIGGGPDKPPQQDALVYLVTVAGQFQQPAPPPNPNGTPTAPGTSSTLTLVLDATTGNQFLVA